MPWHLCFLPLLPWAWLLPLHRHPHPQKPPFLFSCTLLHTEGRAPLPLSLYFVIPAVLPLFTALGHRSAVRGWEALNIIHLWSPLNNTSPVVSARLTCNGKQHHLSGREEKQCCYADKRRAITARTLCTTSCLPCALVGLKCWDKGKIGLHFMPPFQTHQTVFSLSLWSHSTYCLLKE